MRTSIAPPGIFCYGIHKPSYVATNLRQGTTLAALGRNQAGETIDNRRNFPPAEVTVPDADWIFEIPNPLPFRGTTYIDKEWADASAADPKRIRLPEPEEVSLSATLATAGVSGSFIDSLPRPLRLALATTSTDAADLIALAHLSCALLVEGEQPMGLQYQEKPGQGPRPIIHDHALYEAVANNPFLPDVYKQIMVLRPGAQGGSEIVGEWRGEDASHVFEYLRRNSYIAGGHYAANMADDAVRYAISALTPSDMRGLRHLYYQRSYVRLAMERQLLTSPPQATLSEEELEHLRLAILAHPLAPPGSATLWGWNFGFDYAPSGYRLHASHQQIHQQYALVPDRVPAAPSSVNGAATRSEPMEGPGAYAFGDLIYDFIKTYRLRTGRHFFECYLKAIAGNRRTDDEGPARPGPDADALRDKPSDLVVFADDQVMLFVPKAQTSQWELQLLTRRRVGNILEADTRTRRCLDNAMLTAMRILTSMGAAMITVIEAGKRFTVHDEDQRLLYCFLPRIPESPGAFSEAQLRWINGHYPEDFAQACRNHL